MARLGRAQPNRPVVRRNPSGPAIGTIAVTFALSGTGTKCAAGTGTISLSTVLTGTGVKHAAGTGTAAVTFTLSGSGTKTTGIGLPPRPRVRWQLVLGPASGGHDLALTEASGRKYTARLTEPSELTFSLNGRHPQAAAVEQLTTDVHLLWTSDTGDTRILDRHRVGQLQDTLDGTSHRLSVNAMDYREVLARRLLHDGDTLTWTSTDQAEIAWALIQQTQAKPSGYLGIVKGWTGTTPTGQLRDRTYEAGDSIGQRIQELSEVIDGFDWDITPVSASTLRLDVWYPQRGTDRGVVLEYGGLVASAQRSEDASDYANAIRYTGGGDTPPAPVEMDAPDLAQPGGLIQGRWEKAYGDDGLTTQTALSDRAAWQLGQSQVVTPVWTVTLRRGAWDGPDHIWLGDTVRLVVRSGRLAVDAAYRVYEVAIDLDDDGGETVQLTLGGPRPDLRKRVRDIERRLTDLERR